MYIKHYKRVTLPEIMINGEELIKYGGGGGVSDVIWQM